LKFVVLNRHLFGGWICKNNSIFLLNSRNQLLKKKKKLFLMTNLRWRDRIDCFNPFIQVRLWSYETYQKWINMYYMYSVIVSVERESDFKNFEYFLKNYSTDVRWFEKVLELRQKNFRVNFKLFKTFLSIFQSPNKITWRNNC
jgi:hypothetical protein